MREPDQVQVSLVVTLRVYDHTSKIVQTCCPSLGGMNRKGFRTSPWPEASYLIDRVPIAHRDLGSFSLRYGITSTCPTIHVSRTYFSWVFFLLDLSPFFFRTGALIGML